MKNKTVAFMYDFDDTLLKGNMQDVLIPIFGFEIDNFWQKKHELAKKNNMDNVLAYLYQTFVIAKEKNINLTKKFLSSFGKNIIFYEGVLTWFDRINNYATKLGITVEHYIISCGMKEIIEGTPIAKKIKKIFASSYMYDKDGKAVWPCHAVNYTNKTQYIYRIRKNLLDDLSNDKDVNKIFEDNEKLPFKNMFYFGDGFSDIPCMKIIKKGGGHSICVFDPNDEKAKEIGKKIFEDKRVNFLAPSNYSEDSELEKIVKATLKQISEAD